jgi:hypothetical protein
METRGYADSWEQDSKAVTLAPPISEAV